MQKQIEKRALIIGCVANLTMAVAGWLVYYLSHSQALLLDGNFSFILFFMGIFGLLLNYLKSKNNKEENLDYLFTFIKSSLIVVVIAVAFIGSMDKVIDYLQGDPTALIETGTIAYYVITVVFICFSLAAFYTHENKQLGGVSEILKTEAMASKIDGFMSSSAGVALMLIGFIDASSAFSFMLFIGDSIAVLLLSLFMIRTPLAAIANSYKKLNLAMA